MDMGGEESARMVTGRQLLRYLNTVYFISVCLTRTSDEKTRVPNLLRECSKPWPI